MKVTVIGSHMCPLTAGALNHLYDADIPVDYKDILGSHADMLTFLKIRDSNDLYANIRGTDRIGLPCFILEDGTITMDLQEVLKKAGC